MENNSTSLKSRSVRCPQCGQPALYAAENKFRPFCSERCRLIDLGEWASESYKVPVENTTADPINDANLDGEDL